MFYMPTQTKTTNYFVLRGAGGVCVLTAGPGHGPAMGRGGNF